MKASFALLSIILLAGCKRTQDTFRRDDTAVVPPVAVSTDTAQAPPTNCGITGVAELTDNGIGDLKEGASVADLRNRCEIVSDSEQPGPEGSKQRVLVVRVGGETVQAIINDDKVWRIEINSPSIRTSDSLGVDTPLHRIATKRGARFFPGEGGVYGFVADHCAMSFRFSVPLRAPRGGDWTAAKIDSAHGDAVVDRVLITKCH